MTNQQTLLKCTNLEVTLQKNHSPPVPILHSTSLQIHQGEWVGVIGETGTGKSTLARALSALPLPVECIRQGQVYLNNQDLLTLPLNERSKVWGRSLAYLHQESALSLNPTIKVLSQMLEGLQLHYPHNTEEENLNTISFWLHTLHLPDAKHLKQKYAHELSGGMQQKILLIMALSLNPTLIIADEITTSLDMINQKRVMKALQLFKQKNPHMGLFFVTHNTRLALRYCDRIIVLYKGRIIEEFQTKMLNEISLHPYTQTLVSIFSPNVQESFKTPPLFHLSQSLQEIKYPMTSPVEQLCQEESQPYSPHHALDDDKKILQIKSLSLSYPPQETKVIDSLSFSINSGDCLAIIGESGSGKSSLLRCLMGLHTSYKGSIEIEGHPIYVLKKERSLHQHISLIWQNPRQALNPLMSVQEILSEPYKIKKMAPSQETLQKLLNSLFLPLSILKKYPPELSGGQCQMIAILRSLATSAKIILLDEPSSSLDHSSQMQLIHVLKKILAEFSVTILFSSHDLHFAYHLATHAAILYQGSFIEYGQRDAVFYRATHPYAKQLNHLFLDQG